MNKNIAILQGGDSSEYIISEKSGQEIFQSLKKTDFNPFRIRVRNGDWIYIPEKGEEKKLDLNDFSLELKKGNKIFFDYAFIIIHGTPGEDGKIQAILDTYNIPYNTGGVLSTSLSFNKHACKVFLKNLSIQAPEGVLIRKGDTIDVDRIMAITGLPCFVKPNSGGSSFGISKVSKYEDIEPAISHALKEDSEVLIESHIEGLELSCGLVKTISEEIIFPVTEIVPTNEFFDFEAKYEKGMSEEITPARIDDAIKEKCQSIASEIYDQLNCKGIVRIDFILKEKNLFFLELNSIPGMSLESIVPKQIRALNMKVEDVLLKVIEDDIY